MQNLGYSDIISIENLFQAWNEFKKGKRGKKDIQAFERHLEDNLFKLHWQLENKTYKHGSYQEFYVQDPKRRHIHKAAVADRVVHHLLDKFLYGLWDKTFIYDSYSCRLNKGTHRGVKRLARLCRKLSKNYSGACWALKCDVKQFFAAVDHKILLSLFKKEIADKDILWLLREIVGSFNSEIGEGKGIPLGNLTSQVFANIYMNELDQFVKHQLKVKYYLRYADDFVFLSERRDKLSALVPKISEFLEKKLKLFLHPNKIIFRKYTWGTDFLGYIVLPHHILPRTKTKRRMFKKMREKSGKYQTLQSYLGYLKHANAQRISHELKNLFSLSTEFEI